MIRLTLCLSCSFLCVTVVLNVERNVLLAQAPAPIPFAPDQRSAPVGLTTAVGNMVVFIDDTDLKVKSEIVDRVPAGFVGKVLAVDGNWLNVSRGSRPGWAPSKATIPANQAIDYFSNAVKQSPDNATLFEAFANVCLWQRDLDAELANHNAAIQLAPNESSWYLNRGQCWGRKGEFSKALADFAEYLRQGGTDDAHFRGVRGTVYAGQQQWDLAIADFDVAIKLDQNLPEPLLGRALVLIARNDLVQAASELSRALKLNPKNAATYLVRGTLYQQMNEYEKARGDFSAAIRLDPTAAEAYLRRGSLWELVRGNFESALQDLKKATELVPSNYLYQNAIGWFLATCPDAKYRNGEQAFDYATKACELSEWKDGGIIDTLAAAYAECSDFANAIKYAEQAISIAPEASKAELQKHLDQFRQSKPWRQ